MSTRVIQDPNAQPQPTGGSAPLSQAQPSPQGMAQPQPQPQTQGATPTSGGGAPASSKASTGRSTGTQAPKQQKASSGMFTNVQKYIDKNKPQAQKMAQNVTKGVQRNVSALQGQGQDLNRQFANVVQTSGPSNVGNAAQEVSNVANAAAGYNTAPTAPTQPEVETRPVDSATSNQEAPVVEPAPVVTTPVSDDRVAELLNMQYQGPYDLTSQGTDFSDFNTKTQELARLQGAATSGDANRLLQNTFGNRQYTQGQRALDSLLLGGQLENIQKDVGQMDTARSIMSGAQNQATTEALKRSGFIDENREAARNALFNIANQYRGDVDTRLTNVEEDWGDVAQHFVDNLYNPEGGSVNLTQQEADILGLKGSGLGLYNAITDQEQLKDLFQASESERQRLLEVDEFDKLSRLSALSNLAKRGIGRDISSELASKVKGTGLDLSAINRDLAGTQTMADAVDKENFKNKMIALEQGFRDMAAEDVTASGVGKKYYTNEAGQTRRHVVGRNVTANLQEGLGDNYNFTQSAEEMFDNPQAFQGSGTTPVWDGQAILDQTISNLTGNLDAIKSSDLLGNRDRKRAIAIEKAYKDANAKLMAEMQNRLESSGFSNRMNIDDSQVDSSRVSALDNILNKNRG